MEEFSITDFIEAYNIPYTHDYTYTHIPYTHDYKRRDSFWNHSEISPEYLIKDKSITTTQIITNPIERK